PGDRAHLRARHLHALERNPRRGRRGDRPDRLVLAEGQAARPAGARPMSRTLDVSGLPKVAFGTKAPLFWGVLGVIAIEGTMYGLLIASYFYVRQKLFVYPDTPIQRSLLALASVNFAVLLVSAWPMHRCAAAALRA